MKRENSVQGKIIKEIYDRFPGSIVLKNDPNYIQGIPDLTVLYNGRYALLECKRSSNETYQSNQEYYLNEQKKRGAFTATIYPENKEEIYHAMEQAFGL